MFFLGRYFLCHAFSLSDKAVSSTAFFILLKAVALLGLVSGPVIGLLVGIWVTADIPRKKSFNEESFPMYLVPGVS